MLNVGKLRHHGTHLAHTKYLTTLSKREKRRRANLGALERVYQAALANIWEVHDADCHAPRCAQLVSKPLASARAPARCLRRGSCIGVARRAEWECWGGMAEVFQPNLSILPWQQIYEKKNINHHKCKWKLGRTDLVQHKHEPLTLGLPPPHLFLHQPATASSWIPRVKHKHHHKEAADRTSWAAESCWREERVGSDTIVTSSCSGLCCGNCVQSADGEGCIVGMHVQSVGPVFWHCGF